MLHLNKKATKVMDILLKDVDFDNHKKIDNSVGCFMAVHVEQVLDFPELENCFSVAHYYIQNGDLMSDPQVVFWKFQNNYYPLTFRQDGGSFAYFEETVFKIDPIKKVVSKYYPTQLKDQVEFCNSWMGNILEQQELEL